MAETRFGKNPPTVKPNHKDMKESTVEALTPRPSALAVDNILEGKIETKPKRKSYGFYLDDEVVEALDELAKQKKTNKSKVLNTLLKSILLDK